MKLSHREPLWGPAVRIFVALTLMTGIAYPLLITGVAKIGFASLAGGSLLMKEGQVIGSAWIGQKFTQSRHFWPRPSAVDYNPMSSGGSNLGPTSQDLKAAIGARKQTGRTGDLLYASASGLDPHISPRSARDQVLRIVQEIMKDPRKQGAFSQKVTTLIEQNIELRQWMVLGEPRVNVLKLNLALDALSSEEGL